MRALSANPGFSAFARCLLPLAALAAMAALAAHEANPGTAAEGLYLAELAAVVLLAAGFLAPAPAFELALGSVLAAATIWAFPASPGRGATILLILTAVLAVAAGRRLAASLPDLPFPVALPLALGAQALLRSELLFEPASLRTATALLVLPVAGAAAVTLLARRHGAIPALIAAGTAVALAPGWNVAATLGLVALAAGDFLRREDLGWPKRILAGLVLLALPFWKLGPGLVAASSGVALGFPLAGLALSAATLAASFWRGSAIHGLEPVAWALLLLPALPFAVGKMDRLARLGAALLLACAVPWNPDLSALAAPLALAALGLPKEGVPSTVQRTWTAAVLAGTALLAAYPWHRAEPLASALALPGLTPDLRSVLVLAAIAAGLVGIASRKTAAAVTAAALLLALLVHLPSPATLLQPAETSFALDAAQPVVEAKLDGQPIASLVLESSLSNGAQLANGTPVATLTLRYPGGGTVRREIRAGEDTGEWAARRQDVAGSARLRSPEGWVSWVAGDFFGRRYRSRWTLNEPGRFSLLRLERRPDLPPDVLVTIHQTELRRPARLAERVLALPEDDPFRGTLAILPLVLLGLAAIHGLGARRGAGRLSPAGTAGELAALGFLLLLALARPHLGLARVEEVVAAGMLLVLAHRLARQTLALRPLLGASLPDRPSVLFFLLPLVAYLAIVPWSAAHRQPDGDEPYYLLITHSLAYDFDADLTNNYAGGDWRHFMERKIEPQPGDPVGPGGELYSRHNELLPMALVPAYRLGGKAGALATMAALTAALAWSTLRLARRYFPDRPGETLAAWALFSFTPPLLLYAYQVWVEVPATLLMVLALDGILGLDGQLRWNRKEWLKVGVPILLLPLVKIRFMLISAPLLALAWWHSGRPRKPILLLGTLLAAVGGGILLYNHFLYSNPLKIHSWEEVDPHRYPPIAYLSGGLGLFWDTAFGLFGAAPLWALVLPALLLLAARSRRLLMHLAALTLPYLVIVAPRSEWYGGWSPPFRYALIALPLLALALVPLFAGRRGPGARALIAGLAAATLALTIVWVVMPGWTYSFANGRTYPLDHLSERLGTDLARFFPSGVRTRAATWIWPPVSLALVALAWWLPSRRDRPSSGETAALAGVAALLLGAAALPALATRTPTRIAELEDPQVSKSGGHLHPDIWVIERARYRGGWVLRVDETLRVPVTPGGRSVKITLHAQFIRNQPVPFRLELKSGDRLLGVWVPGRSRAWETVTFGPFDWPAGEPLVLSGHGPHPPGPLNGAILDKVDFEWH